MKTIKNEYFIRKENLPIMNVPCIFEDCKFFEGLTMELYYYEHELNCQFKDCYIFSTYNEYDDNE